MKFVLGFYSQINSESLREVYSRSISCILKPVLTYIHNNRECRLSIALPSALINFLSANFPEINLLIASLVKSGSIELFTSAYNNTVLSLIPHRDRSVSVEKTTTLIRKTYGLRATSLWCYGQIWAPSIITMMKTTGLERLVISSYDALSQKTASQTSFVMNELGKKISVLQSNDTVSRLVSSYAQNEITLGTLRSSLTDFMRDYEGQQLNLMLNIDQLCQGASYNREDDEELAMVFIDLFNAAKEKGAEIILARDLVPSEVGYLHNGWFGRDAAAGCLDSFNELFVRIEGYRYMLGRYMALVEAMDEAKGEKVVRKRLQDQLSSLASGSLFLCDTHASCLSLDLHRRYYRTVLEAERLLDETGYCLTSHDIDDDGLEEEFCYGKLSNAVFSRRGGSVDEFSSKELQINLFDSIPSWDKCFEKQSKLKSFVDSYTLNGKDYDLSNQVYELKSVNRSRSEFTFSAESEDSIFEVSKHYRLTNQNLYMSHTIVNRNDEFLKGDYVATVYFTIPGSSAFAYDANRQPLVGSGIAGIKSVRFSDPSHGVQLSFTSTDFFSVEEENRYQSEVTTLGSQQFYLYTKVRFRFAINVAPISAQSLNIVTRISSAKEKQ